MSNKKKKKSGFRKMIRVKSFIIVPTGKIWGAVSAKANVSLAFSKVQLEAADCRIPLAGFDSMESLQVVCFSWKHGASWLLFAMVAKACWAWLPFSCLLLTPSLGWDGLGRLRLLWSSSLAQRGGHWEFFSQGGHWQICSACCGTHFITPLIISFVFSLHTKFSSFRV